MQRDVHAALIPGSRCPNLLGGFLWMPQPHCLPDAGIAAIRALQEAALAAVPDDPVWLAPLSMNLVWLDTELRPKIVRLTERGRAYPTA